MTTASIADEDRQRWRVAPTAAETTARIAVADNVELNRCKGVGYLGVGPPRWPSAPNFRDYEAITDADEDALLEAWKENYAWIENDCGIAPPALGSGGASFADTFIPAGPELNQSYMMLQLESLAGTPARRGHVAEFLGLDGADTALGASRRSVRVNGALARHDTAGRSSSDLYDAMTDDGTASESIIAGPHSAATTGLLSVRVVYDLEFSRETIEKIRFHIMLDEGLWNIRIQSDDRVYIDLTGVDAATDPRLNKLTEIIV